MASSGTIQVEGIPQLNRRLSTFNHRLQKKIMRATVRSGAGPMKKAAKKLAPRKSGRLAESMGIKVKQYQGDSVTVGVVGPRKKFKSKSKGFKGQTIDAFYGRWIHEGTKPHRIPKASAGRTLLAFAGIVTPYVEHPGTRPNRFMQRAATQSKSSVIAKFTETFNKQLNKFLKFGKKPAKVLK